MTQYFPEPKSLRGKVKVELNLSNYATKIDFKNATEFDTSSFAKNVDLSHLKTVVDKLDIDKLKNLPTNLSNFKCKSNKLDVDKLVPVPVDLSKVSDVVKKDVQKDAQNLKIIKDKIPDITNLAINATLNAKIVKDKKGISSITNLAAITALNAKINEVKSKVSNITNLATTTALTAVGNKIPNVNNLLKENWL